MLTFDINGLFARKISWQGTRSIFCQRCQALITHRHLRSLNAAAGVPKAEYPYLTLTYPRQLFAIAHHRAAPATQNVKASRMAIGK